MGHAGTKDQLKGMFDARNVIQFAEFYPVGHRSTNYHKFFNVTEPYAIRFKSGYEPYVLVARKLVPWYDERFRGYGWDKVRLHHVNFDDKFVAPLCAAWLTAGHSH